MGHWKKKVEEEGAPGGERNLDQVSRGTGRKDTQWPKRDGVQIFVGDRFQTKQSFPITKESLGQKQLLCKVT